MMVITLYFKSRTTQTNERDILQQLTVLVNDGNIVVIEANITEEWTACADYASPTLLLSKFLLPLFLSLCKALLQQVVAPRWSPFCLYLWGFPFFSLAQLHFYYVWCIIIVKPCLCMFEIRVSNSFSLCDATLIQRILKLLQPEPSLRQNWDTFGI